MAWSPFRMCKCPCFSRSRGAAGGAEGHWWSGQCWSGAGVMLESRSAAASLRIWPQLLLRSEKMKPNGMLENLPSSEGDAV